MPNCLVIVLSILKVSLKKQCNKIPQKEMPVLYQAFCYNTVQTYILVSPFPHTFHRSAADGASQMSYILLKSTSHTYLLWPIIPN